MPRLRLKKKEQIAVLLRLLIVREETFLKICGIFEMVCDLVLLFIIFSPITNEAHFQDVLLPMPCDSGSKVLFSNQDIEHPFRVQNSFSIDWKSWLCSRVGSSGLFDPSVNN